LNCRFNCAVQKPASAGFFILVPRALTSMHNLLDEVFKG